MKLFGTLHQKLHIGVRWSICRDYPQMAAISERSFEHGSPDPTDPYCSWNEEQIRKLLGGRSGEFFFNVNCKIAELGDKVVGFIVFCFIQEHCEIIRLAVDPDYRRRGVATQLVQSKKDKLVCGRTLLADVDERDFAGQVFFRHCGFTVCDIRRGEGIADGDAAYRFQYPGNRGEGLGTRDEG